MRALFVGYLSAVRPNAWRLSPRRAKRGAARSAAGAARRPAPPGAPEPREGRKRKLECVSTRSEETLAESNADRHDLFDLGQTFKKYINQAYCS